MPLTDSEVLAGALDVRFGQRRVTLPILTIAQNETWQALVGQRLATDVGGLSYESLANLHRSTGATFDTVVELVLAYDLSNVLGGREVLRTEASNAQVWALFRRLLEASYPFATDLRTVALVVMDMISRAQVIAAMAEVDQTRGPTSTPTLPATGTPSPTASATN